MQVLRCKKRALSQAEIELADAAEDIDSKYTRPTPDEVKALLEKMAAGSHEGDAGGTTDSEAVHELGQ